MDKTIKEVIESFDSTQKFADAAGVPWTTANNWRQGTRKLAPYLVKWLIAYLRRGGNPHNI